MLKVFNQSEIEKVTKDSGCYLLYNSKEEIIYIGKAKNLAKRIKNYLPKKEKEIHFQKEIIKFKIILTSNEKEALLLEEILIKKHRPRYNILLKDNHFYPHILITKGKDPRYKLVRGIKREENIDCFGPFPDGSKAREILQILERLFPLAKCQKKLDRKPCFYYSINQCSGYCWKEIKKEYYEEKIEEIKKFFSGDVEKIKEKIQRSIQQDIENLTFEMAKKKKAILDSLDFFHSKQNIDLKKKVNLDFVGIFSKNDVISISLLNYRFGKLLNADETISLLFNDNEEEIIENYLSQFYSKNLSPDFIILEEKKANNLFLTEILKSKIRNPLNQEEKNIIKLAQKTANQNWNNNYLNNFSRIKKIQLLEELAQILKITRLNSFYCLDVSNLYYQNPVAVFLAFFGGEKDLSKSSFYKLETQEGSDLDRIAEAIYLHYKNLSLNEKEIDLILVDGGLEQVKTVKKMLESFKLTIPVAGLAKNKNHRTEKIVTPDLKYFEFESKDSMLKNFLSKCQDDVHNLAIGFHRKLHRRTTLN